MSPRPQVSVVIPYYEQPDEYLFECLRSVQTQTFPDWEVIVVDDASVEWRAEVVVAELHDPRVRLVKHKENRGEAASRNTGVRAGRADFLAPLDPDDRIEPEYLEAMVQALRDRPEADWVLTDWLMFGACEGILRFPHPLPPLCPAHFNARSPGLIRRRVWETVGGYCEEGVFRAGGPDLDFWLGAVERGFRPIHISRPLYWYRLHEASASAGSFPYSRYRIHEALYRRHKELFDSFDGPCQQCPPRNRIGEYLSSGYFTSSEAALARKERFRAMCLALKGFALYPRSARSIRRLIKAFAPEAAVAFVGRLK